MHGSRRSIGESDNLRDRLRSGLEIYRTEQSRSLGKSPSLILPDKVIEGICALDPLPATPKDLSVVKGLGAKKLELFGTGILGLVSRTVVATAFDPLESIDAACESGVVETLDSTTLPLTTPPSPALSPILQPEMEGRSENLNRVGLLEQQRQQQQRVQIRYHSSNSSTTNEDGFGIDNNNNGKKDDTGPNPRPQESKLRYDLEEYRNEKSKTLGKSPLLILPDKVIDGICALDPPPSGRNDLLAVKGLGAKKLELFGDEILGLVMSTFNTGDSASALDEHASPSPHSETNVEEKNVPSLDSLDSYVAPAPYSAPESNAGVLSMESYVAPAPYSAPKGDTVIGTLDSYVAPAPYSFSDEDEDEDDEFEISEESFGAVSPMPTRNDQKEENGEAKPKKNETTKLSKTQLKMDLKEYRTSQHEDGKPIYTVFTNAALDGIYAALPTTKSELLDVKGIGPSKLDLYGDDILALVAPYAGMGFNKDLGGTSESDSDVAPVRPPERIDPESLTAEQRTTADMIFGIDPPLPEGSPRRNVFVTGSAGTGKSHLLKYIVEVLQGRQKDASHSANVEEGLVVGVCAPTGVAAIIVGGSTLHSFFGIGLGTGSRSSLLNKVRKNTAARTRIDETDILIIDECSMLSADLLETLDMVARAVRKDGWYSDEPFGGMQVIAFGDFFQLPPVYRYDGSHDRSWRPFCFESEVWSELGLSENIVELKEVQRQEHGDFVNFLGKVRTGTVDHADINDLNRKCVVGPNNPLPNDGILPTRLYVLNKDVDSQNINRLRALSGEEVVCKATDVWRQSMPVGTPASVKKKMKDSLDMELPDEVRLKVGAQVMLTRNKDLVKNLVNGSRGVVERFETNQEGSPIPVVRFDSGIVTRIDPAETLRYNLDGGRGCLVRMQVPLKLAWAITIHKSQGSSLTRASLDISSAFEYGQCYVALSRVRSLEGLWLERPAELRNIKVSPQVVDLFSRKD